MLIMLGLDDPLDLGLTNPLNHIEPNWARLCDILNRSPRIEELEDDTMWHDMTRCDTSQGIAPFVSFFAVVVPSTCGFSWRFHGLPELPAINLHLRAHGPTFQSLNPKLPYASLYITYYLLLLIHYFSLRSVMQASETFAFQDQQSLLVLKLHSVCWVSCSSHFT